MGKLMRIPLLIPIIGLIVSFVLLIIVAHIPNTPLLIAALVLLHLSGWILAAKYFICGITSFSAVLSTK